MRQHQIDAINQALDCDEDLTEWEYDFIHDLAEKSDEEPPIELSAKQDECLARIADKLGIDYDSI